MYILHVKNFDGENFGRFWNFPVQPNVTKICR